VHQGPGRHAPALCRAGDEIIASVKKRSWRRDEAGRNRQGRDRPRQEADPRADGTYVRFDHNAMVIINKEDENPGARASSARWP